MMTTYPKEYLYEILIRGNADGTLKGAHQITSTVFAEGVERIGNATPLAVAEVGKVLGSAFPGLAKDLLAAQARCADLEREIEALKAAAQPVTETDAIVEDKTAITT